jgi:hypothetical protein
MLLGFSWLHAQLNGTYNITGNYSNPSNGEFATIQEAFNALMRHGVEEGGVTFVVQESWRTTKQFKWAGCRASHYRAEHVSWR